MTISFHYNSNTLLNSCRLSPRPNDCLKCSLHDPTYNNVYCYSNRKRKIENANLRTQVDLEGVEPSSKIGYITKFYSLAFTVAFLVLYYIKLQNFLELPFDNRLHHLIFDIIQENIFLLQLWMIRLLPPHRILLNITIRQQLSSRS